MHTDKKYKYSENDARRLADTLITGIKKVVNGDYAVLTIPGDSYTYYKRERSQWVVDETIDPEIMSNNQSLLCNFNQHCIEVDKKYQAVCQTIGSNKTEIEKNMLREITTNAALQY